MYKLQRYSVGRQDNSTSCIRCSHAVVQTTNPKSDKAPIILVAPINKSFEDQQRHKPTLQLSKSVHGTQHLLEQNFRPQLRQSSLFSTPSQLRKPRQHVLQTGRAQDAHPPLPAWRSTARLHVTHFIIGCISRFVGTVDNRCAGCSS